MISVAVLTKNEEKNILDCVESVLWADEIIIIDDYSEDRTLDVIRNLGKRKIKIFQRNLDGDFSKQRNFALSKAQNDWVLFVDADEIITLSLRSEINDFLISAANDIKGLYIRRKDYIWGKKINHGESGNIKLIRLGRKNAGDWTGKVHEVWNIEDNLQELENEILHFPHPTINSFLKEINFYTTLRAEELFNKKIKTSLLQIVFYPKAKFVLNYFFKLGFLDGIEGLILAILMSFHSFLVRSKLWILWKTN